MIELAVTIEAHVGKESVISLLAIYRLPVTVKLTGVENNLH